MENLPEAALLVSVVTGLTEAIKRAVGERLTKRWTPVAAIVIGVLLAVVAQLSLIDGLVIGLSGVGLYSGGRAFLQR